ncbi:MAG: hypothetical protein J6L69_10435 [Lachnospiraceae bacterium]|nr:hypothetical protein [Lachnospiraceae bacterium]
MEIYDYADLDGKKSWDYTARGITPKDEGIKPILITSKEVDMGDLVVINGNVYAVHSMTFRGKEAIAAYTEKIGKKSIFLSDEEPEKLYDSDELICPYCGYKDDDCWENTDSDDNYECPNCHSIYAYKRERILTYSYNCIPVKKNELVVLE